MGINCPSTIIGSQILITDFLEQNALQDDIKEVLEGLHSWPKYALSKYFYDKAGSALFESITKVPEYYPTRTEKNILRKIAPVIAEQFKGDKIIELGSGDCSKISIIFEAFNPSKRKKIWYIPVDFSRTAMLESSALLGNRFPEITIHCICTDFIKQRGVIPQGSGKLICFFGSTIGNLSREQVFDFLIDIKNLMQPGDQFLLGLDMVKDPQILESAYNDKQNVTEAFNRNIIHVINNIIKTNFDPELFEHKAFYNSGESRIEMHLKAIADMKITSPLFQDKIILKKGETIHTENSHKYTLEDIRYFEKFTGLKIKEIFSDENQWFSIVQFMSIV